MDSIHYATEIVKKLTNAGHTAYFAGGWVRDHMMHHDSFDIDIATDATPQKILELFPHTILVGIAFGVVIVTMGGHQFEVATFRKDFGYSDGRKPDKIEFTNAEGDAQRRDFTINGMFYDPLKHVVHDYVSGSADLQKGLIKAIGNPYERFMEDRLRMIRAVRFASRFAFAIDPETQEAISANADSLFPSVALERVWMEFKKMAGAPRFNHALVEMQRLGLLSVIFPRLRDVHIRMIVQQTAIFESFPAETPTALYLCELFPDASIEELTDIFQNLHISNQELKVVVEMTRAKPYLGSAVELDRLQKTHFYALPHTPLVLGVYAARLPSCEREAFIQHHAEQQHVLATHIERVKAKKPLVNALLLKNAGISPGVTMGILLKEAEKIAVNQDLHDHEVVLQQLQKSHHWPKE